MKKVFAWSTVMIIMIFLIIAAVPVKADTLWKPLCAGSPHYYGEPGPKDNPEWYEAHRTVVGQLSVWNDAENLYVTYYTDAIGMLETHLAVAEDFEDIPKTGKGNPKVGHFPYKHEDLGGVLTDQYTIPLEEDWEAGDTLFLAAHAALVNGETAWADCGGPEAYFAGPGFSGGNWATWFTYTLQAVV